MNSFAKWTKTRVPELLEHPVAYFSSEIKIPGFHNMYAGGLGILAGEFVEGLTQVGIPVVAFSLLYKKRLVQKMDLKSGQTQYELEDMDFSRLPLKESRKKICLKMQGGDVHARIWETRLGEAHVYLLDSDVEENNPEARKLTEVLYREEGVTRLRQEILLGRGGLLALDALDVTPSLIHLNDSATAFAFLKDDLTRFASTRIVYTTHTVKSSSIRRYPRDLIAQTAPELVNFMSFQKFIEDFHGTVNLHHGAMGACDIANAVSDEHERATLREYFATFSDKFISIVNGIDLQYWMHPEIRKESEKGYLPREKWWEIKRQAKIRLIDFINREAFGPRLSAAHAFKPDVFTITVARRFQDYKRNTLILKHIWEIQRRIDPHEIQIIFGGKPHPTDEHALKMFEMILNHAKNPPPRVRVAYLPNYDIDSAQVLVQGSDAWLNNPEVPYEACGTSYQKAMANGTLVITTETGGPLQHALDYRVDTEKGNAVRIAEFVGPHHLSHDLVTENFVNAVVQPALLYYEKRGEFARIALQSVQVAPQLDVRRMAQEYAIKMYLPVVLVESVIRGVSTVRIATGGGSQSSFPCGQPIEFIFEVEMKPEKRKEFAERVQAELWFGFHGQKYNPLPAEYFKCEGDRCFYRAVLIPQQEGVYHYTARVSLSDPRMHAQKVYRWKEGEPHKDPHFVVSAKLPQEAKKS